MQVEALLINYEFTALHNAHTLIIIIVIKSILWYTSIWTNIIQLANENWSKTTSQWKLLKKYHVMCVAYLIVMIVW